MTQIDPDFSVKIESIKTGKTIRFKAYIDYIGDDSRIHDFLEKKRKQSIAFISLSITKIKSYSYTIVDSRTRYNELHDGILHSFYNYASQYNMYEEFPVLKKVKGASLALLMCCFCDAIKTGYITGESKIFLEASGAIEGKDRTESMKELVRMYERLGFEQVFPHLYTKGIEYELVPMIASVKRIMQHCKFDTISQELRDILPIKMCLEICGGL